MDYSRCLSQYASVNVYTVCSYSSWKLPVSSFLSVCPDVLRSASSFRTSQQGAYYTQCGPYGDELNSKAQDMLRARDIHYDKWCQPFSGSARDSDVACRCSCLCYLCLLQLRPPHPTTLSAAFWSIPRASHLSGHTSAVAMQACVGATASTVCYLRSLICACLRTRAVCVQGHYPDPTFRATGNSWIQDAIPDHQGGHRQSNALKSHDSPIADVLKSCALLYISGYRGEKQCDGACHRRSERAAGNQTMFSFDDQPCMPRSFCWS